MVQKSHPIGLRLTISTLWLFWLDPIFNKHLVQQQFFLYQWIKGFFEKNFLLLATVQFLATTRWYDYLSIAFYLSPMIIKTTRRNVLSLNRVRVKLRNKQHFPFFLQLFQQKYVQLYSVFFNWQYAKKTQPNSWKFELLPFSRTNWVPSFLFPLKKKKLKVLLKKKKLNSSFDKRTLQQQIEPIIQQYSHLRLKSKLEFLLTNLGRKKIFVFLTNLHQRKQWTGSSPTSFSIFQKKVMPAYGISPLFFSFARIFCELTLFAVLLQNPSLLLQYLFYQLIFLKKHAIQLSHTSFFALLTRTLEILLHCATGLHGFLFIIRGKYDNHARSKTRSYTSGESYSPQRLVTRLAYGIRHISGYGGIFSFRLWFIY